MQTRPFASWDRMRKICPLDFAGVLYSTSSYVTIIGTEFVFLKRWPAHRCSRKSALHGGPSAVSAGQQVSPRFMHSLASLRRCARALGGVRTELCWATSQRVIQLRVGQGRVCGRHVSLELGVKVSVSLCVCVCAVLCVAGSGLLCWLHREQFKVQRFF